MTAGALLAKAEARLASRGVPEASANAEFLIAAALQVKRGELRARASRFLDPRQERRLWRQVLQLARRRPLAYVLGTVDFMGLELSVNPSVLIPRPETEELVEAAADCARRLQASRPEGAPLNIMEIGTGSGCVSIALAQLLPEASIYATDISPRALALAAKNARRRRLGARIRFVRSDLFQPVRRDAPLGWADIIVSNPPYVPTAEIDRLEPEVLQEPRLALDGGPDGLDATRAIAAQAPATLKGGGWLVLEIGRGQGPAVIKLLQAAGFSAVELAFDLQGVERIALGRMTPI